MSILVPHALPPNLPGTREPVVEGSTSPWQIEADPTRIATDAGARLQHWSIHGQASPVGRMRRAPVDGAPPIIHPGPFEPTGVAPRQALDRRPVHDA